MLLPQLQNQALRAAPSLSAGHSVSIEAGSSSSNYDGKSQSGSNGLFSFQDKAQTSIQDQGIVRSTVNGGSVVISSGQGTGVGDITLSGLTVNAKALTLNAADGNGTLNLNVAQTQHDESRTSASNSALWQSQGGQGSSNTDAQYNQFNLGENQPEITKGAGTALAGTAGTTGTTSTKSDTTVAMLSPAAGVGSASTALVDSTALTATSNTGVAGLTINAAKVNVQVGVTSHKNTDGEDSTFTKGTLQSSIQQLASQPGTAYIATLQSQLQSNPAFKNPDGTSKVNWQQIDQAHQNWNYESQGLTAAGAAVVALIVAACTAGAGIAALGPMTAGAMGFTGAAASVVSAAVVAGAGSLITQASISLINNQGDLGKTFQDLGSSQSLKQLATAMVTAGALQGININMGWVDASGASTITAQSSFVDQLGKNLVNNTAGAMISTAINGGSVEKNLQSALVSAFIQTGAAQTANAIGDATMGGVFSNSDLANKFANLTAHAIAGCIAGAATSSAGGGNGAAASSGCGAGAIGAAVGEATASLYGRANNTVEVASLVSGIAAVLVGGDANAVNIASAAGGNAAANNFLNHDDTVRKQKLEAALRGNLPPALRESYLAELNALNLKDKNSGDPNQQYGTFVGGDGKSYRLPVTNCPAASCQTGDFIARFGGTPEDQATLAAYDNSINKRGAAVALVVGVPAAVAVGAPALYAAGATAQTAPLAGGVAGVSTATTVKTIFSGFMLAGGAELVLNPAASPASIFFNGSVGAGAGVVKLTANAYFGLANQWLPTTWNNASTYLFSKDMADATKLGVNNLVDTTANASWWTAPVATCGLPPRKACN